MKRTYTWKGSEVEAEDATWVPVLMQRMGLDVRSPLVVTVKATGERVRVEWDDGEVPRILWNEKDK